MESKEYIFDNSDFETFKGENKFKTDTEINARRKIVQDKLKKIHEQLHIKLLANKINLSEHYSKKNLTSLPYNNITTPRDTGVDWLGIRYGISESEAKKQGVDITGKNKISGFLEHQCMQINVAEDCVEIGLYHSTKNGTFDDAYIRKRLANNDKALEEEIIDAIKKMYGCGLVWHIGEKRFEIDNNNPSDFIEFYKNNDYPGLYSKCTVEIPKFDIRITEENFVDTCLFYISKLYPMYLTLSYKKS